MSLSRWHFLLVAFCGCAPPSQAEDMVARFHPLPPVEAALSTLDRMLQPQHAVTRAVGPNPALPANLPAYVQQGFGQVRTAPGEQPYVVRTIDGSVPPALGQAPRLLARFAHLSDLQVADDESPTRVGLLDDAGPLESALRPQDPYLCRMANAAVRTINALHRSRPLSFVLLGGDNADSAQENEIDWVLQILDGADEVKCDSGQPDDPVPGPDNDGKDPFRPEGLIMPWWWVTGNHDVLVQGNSAVTEALRRAAVGNDAPLGTRDYTQGGAVASGEFVIPDERRRPLYRQELMRKVAATGGGHGISAAQIASGKAFYHFDVPGTALRFLVLDTSAESGGGSGLLHQADVDAFVGPALLQARAEGKWVVLSSHHPVDNLSQDGGELGTLQADAILPDSWKQTLGQYDNVLFSMVGHYHGHQVQAITPRSGHAYWEVVTSAIADHPHEFRVVEIWDGDNGWVLLRAVCVDLALDGDPVAAQGRQFGVIDYTSGWRTASGQGQKEDRNVELWIRRP